jgi:hypothetical protein
MIKNLKQLFLVFFLGLTVAFTGVAYSQDFYQDRKPPEKRKEKDKPPPDKDRGDNRSREDDKNKKDRRKPD